MTKHVMEKIAKYKLNHICKVFEFSPKIDRLITFGWGLFVP
jgi:hypothetical protein